MKKQSKTRRQSDNPCIRYLDLGPIPVYLAVALDKKSYDKEMARLNVSSPAGFCSGAGPGSCVTMERTSRLGNQTVIIVCIDKARCKKATAIEIAGLVVHESSHALDSILEAMDEDKAGGEFKAYTLQHIVQQVLLEMR